MEPVEKIPATLNQRIKLIRKKLELSQAEFAERLGINRAHISRIESGHATPSEQLLRLIWREYSINWTWLTKGYGAANLDEELSRQDERALVALDAMFSRWMIFGTFTLPFLVEDLRGCLERVVNSGSLTPQIIEALRSFKKFPYDEILPLIDQILSHYPETEPSDG
jgi:transcriptional regulator with XRE-family HTH domain